MAIVVPVLLGHTRSYINTLLGYKRGYVPQQANTVPGLHLYANRVEGLRLPPFDVDKPVGIGVVQYLLARLSVYRNGAVPGDDADYLVSLDGAATGRHPGR